MASFDLCLVTGCGRPAAVRDAVALCAAHLDVAAEVAGPDRTDLLPAPCRLCGGRLGMRLPGGWVCAVCEWPHGGVPDGDLLPPRVDVVYYLAFGDRVKIGTTANPRRRLAAIRHDRLLALERGDRALEQRRHREFAAEREWREWFALSERLRAHVDVLAGGVDPWDRWARWIAEAAAVR